MYNDYMRVLPSPFQTGLSQSNDIHASECTEQKASSRSETPSGVLLALLLLELIGAS